MAGKFREACGRCSMSSVVDMATDEDGEGHDPFGDARIEVPEADLRTVMFASVLLGRLKRRLNEVATDITYGRAREP
jgi:hypothetical protein